MPDFIATAISRYKAQSPQEQLQTRAAFTAIGGFFLYLGFEAVSEGWRRALGIFLAVAVFCAVCALAGWIGNGLSKLIGRKAGNAASVIIVLGFIGFVIYVIGANWGR
jgi:hypothetical protein